MKTNVMNKAMTIVWVMIRTVVIRITVNSQKFLENSVAARIANIG